MLEELDRHRGSGKIGFIPNLIHQDQFQLHQSFKYKHENFQLVEANMGEFSYSLAIGKEFQIKTQSPEALKEKTENCI